MTNLWKNLNIENLSASKIIWRERYKTHPISVDRARISESSSLIVLPHLPKSDRTQGYLLLKIPLVCTRIFAQIRMTNKHICKIYCNGEKYVLRPLERCNVCYLREAYDLYHFIVSCPVHKRVKGQYFPEAIDSHDHMRFWINILASQNNIVIKRVVKMIFGILQSLISP